MHATRRRASKSLPRPVSPRTRIWNGISPRDQEATRRVATIERGIALFLISPGWEPYYGMERYGVFASSGPLAKETLWTIVNRNEYSVHERQMRTLFKAGTN